MLPISMMKQRLICLYNTVLGYLDIMKKILVDDAHKMVFYDLVYDDIVGLEIEFASRPPLVRGLFKLDGGTSMKGFWDG